METSWQYAFHGVLKHEKETIYQYFEVNAPHEALHIHCINSGSGWGWGGWVGDGLNNNNYITVH